MPKNILVGKLGKSIKFKKSSWSLSGGNEGIFNLIKLLSNLNPELNFYIGGPSDFNNLDKSAIHSLFPNNNVHQLPISRSGYEEPLNYLLDNHIHIDAGVIMCGMSPGVSIPGKIKKRTGDDIAKTLNWGRRYCAPYVHILNELQIPFFTISEDPRNTKINNVDLFNVEKKCLSLEKNQYFRDHIKSYDDQNLVRVKVPVEYKNIELLCLYGKEKYQYLSPLGRNLTMNIFMNKFGLTNAQTRKPFIEEYVLPSFPEAKIYGLWTEEVESGDIRFQNKKIVDIPDILYRTKYTVIKSLKPNFISGKPWEMINHGIIPFLSPDYDGDRILPLPRFLYLESPADLMEKIRYLESNTREYVSLWDECQSLLKPEYYSGEYLNNIIKKEIMLLGL